MGRVLAILDKDEEYVKNLMEYMKQKKEFNFSVVAFTDGAAYLEYEEVTNVAILLHQESYDSVLINKSNAKQKVTLREVKNVLPSESLSIFKYQSIELIMKEILRLFEGEDTSRYVTAQDGNAMIISVCSSTQEVSTTKIALALAYEYSKCKRVLFLSFDAFFTTKIIGVKEEMQGISDLIYYAKQKNNNFNTKIKSLISHKESLDYILGVSHWSDISELLEEELDHILKELKNQLGYDLIIIDVGMFANITNGLLTHSDCIYEVLNKGIFYLQKANEFHRQLLIKTEKNIMERFITIPALKDGIEEEDIWTAIKTGSYHLYVKELIIDKK